MKETCIPPICFRFEFAARLWLVLAAVSLCFITAAHADDRLPVPWNGMDIGGATPAGSSQLDNGTFTVTAGGAGLAGASDQFHFVYQSITGDFALVARVIPPADAGDHASAGLMVRDALAATSNFAAIVQTHGHDAMSEYRTPCAPRTGTDEVNASASVWIRLVKRGTTVTTFLASDSGGTHGPWKKVGSDEPTASGMVYVGLCLTSQTPGTNCTAAFDHVSLDTGPQPLLDNGVYTITPVSAPALVLGAAGGIVGLSAPAGPPGQKWVFTGKGGDAYDIQPSGDQSLALTVVGGGSASGTKLTLQADQGLSSQRWSVLSNSNGTFGLVPQCAPDSGLDDFGGNTTLAAQIDIWQRWDSDPHTQWTITPAP